MYIVSVTQVIGVSCTSHPSTILANSHLNMSCPNCFSGNIHQGTPRGEVTSLHGLEAYTTKPLNNVPHRGIIIIVPDAFGWEFVNNRILADHYAEKGKYLVYLPEFMNGMS